MPGRTIIAGELLNPTGDVAGADQIRETADRQFLTAQEKARIPTGAVPDAYDDTAITARVGAAENTLQRIDNTLNAGLLNPAGDTSARRYLTGNNFLHFRRSAQRPTQFPQFNAAGVNTALNGWHTQPPEGTEQLWALLSFGTKTLNTSSGVWTYDVESEALIPVTSTTASEASRVQAVETRVSQLENFNSASSAGVATTEFNYLGGIITLPTNWNEALFVAFSWDASAAAGINLSTRIYTPAEINAVFGNNRAAWSSNELLLADGVALQVREVNGELQIRDTGGTTLNLRRARATWLNVSTADGASNIQIDQRIAEWARTGSNTPIPADKLVNAPGSSAAEVDARIAPFARTGSTTDIPESQIPPTITRDSEVGAQVDARVEPFARTGSNNTLPDNKLPPTIPADHIPPEIARLSDARQIVDTEVRIWARDDNTPVPREKLTEVRTLDDLTINARISPWARLADQSKIPNAKLLPESVTLTAGTILMLGEGRDYLYTVHPSTGLATPIGATRLFGTDETRPAGLAEHNGQLFMVGATNQALYSIDIATGIATRIGTATAFGVGELHPEGLASFNDELFMVGRERDALFRLDTQTGIATRVGNVSQFGAGEQIPSGLAAHNGQLLMVGRGNDALYSLNATTGQATRIGTLSEFGAGIAQPQGLASTHGHLYMVANDTDALYTLNPSTGQATRVNATLENFGANEISPTALTALPMDVTFTVTPVTDATIPASIARTADIPEWARDDTTPIPADKLTNAPAGGGGDSNTATWARQDNTDTIPEPKIPGSIARNSDLPTNQQIENIANAEIASEVEQWARDGSTPIPDGKLSTNIATNNFVNLLLQSTIGPWALQTATSRVAASIAALNDNTIGWREVAIAGVSNDQTLGLPAENGNILGLTFVWGSGTDFRQLFIAGDGTLYYRNNTNATTNFSTATSPELQHVQARLQDAINRLGRLETQPDNTDAQEEVILNFLKSIAELVITDPEFKEGWAGAMFDITHEAAAADGGEPDLADWQSDSTIASNDVTVTRRNTTGNIPADDQLDPDEDDDRAPSSFAKQPATRRGYYPNSAQLAAAVGPGTPDRRLYGFGLAFPADGGAWDRFNDGEAFGEGYDILSYLQDVNIRPLLRADSAGNFLQVLSHANDTVVNRETASLPAYGHPSVTVQNSADATRNRMVWSVHDNVAEGQPIILRILSTQSSQTTGLPYASLATGVANQTRLAFADRDTAENNTGAFYEIALLPDNTQHPHVTGRFKYVPNATAYGGRDIVVFDFDPDDSIGFTAFVEAQVGTLVPAHDTYVSTHIHLERAQGKHGFFVELYNDPDDPDANTMLRVSYNGSEPRTFDIQRRLTNDQANLLIGDQRTNWWFYNGFYGKHTRRLTDAEFQRASSRQATAAPVMLTPSSHYERMDFSEDQLRIEGEGISDYTDAKITAADRLPDLTAAHPGQVLGVGADGSLVVQEAARQISVQYGDNILDGSTAERSPLTSTASNTEAEILAVPSETLSNTRLDLGLDGHRILLVFQEGNSANLFEWEIILPHNAHEFSTPHEDYRVLIGSRQTGELDGLRAVQLRHRRGSSWTLQQIKRQIVPEEVAPFGASDAQALIAPWARAGTSTTVPDIKIPGSIARDSEIPTDAEIDTRADNRITAGVESWARDDSTPIPAGKLTNVPTTGGGGGGGLADLVLKEPTGTDAANTVGSIQLPENYLNWKFLYVMIAHSGEGREHMFFINTADLDGAATEQDDYLTFSFGVQSGGTGSLQWQRSTRTLTSTRIVSAFLTSVSGGGGGGGIDQDAVEALIADWAETDNADTIPVAKLPGGKADNIVLALTNSLLTAREITLPENYADWKYLIIGARDGGRSIYDTFRTASLASGNLPQAANGQPQLRLVNTYWDRQNRVLSQVGTSNDKRYIEVVLTDGGYGGSSGGGLDQDGVEALISDWAETGNTDTVPEDKISAAIARTNQLPTDADIDGRADARVAAGVEDWAETDNADTLPAAKIPAAIARTIPAAVDGYVHLGVGDLDGGSSGLITDTNTVQSSSSAGAPGAAVSLRYDPGITATNIPSGASYNSATGSLVLPAGHWIVCASVNMQATNTPSGNADRDVATLSIVHDGNERHANSLYMRNANFANTAYQGITGKVSVTGAVIADGTAATQIMVRVASQVAGESVTISGAHVHAYRQLVAAPLP